MKRRLTLVLLLTALVSTACGATTWEELTAPYRARPLPAPAPAIKLPPLPDMSKKPAVPAQAVPATKLEKGIAELYMKHNKTLDEQRAGALAVATVKAAEKWNVDPALMAGIVVVESRANVKARNKSMLGLCQVHWGVHKKSIPARFPHIRKAEDLYDPENNLEVGCWIMAGALRRAKGNVKTGLGYYLGRRNKAYIHRVLKLRAQALKG